jgi:hypothetical protein
VPFRRGRHLEAFTEDGVIHPIRDSPGYSPEVEKMQTEHRHEAERAHKYRGLARGRSEVQRPEWAHGLTDIQVRQIAKEHGVSAESEAWWHRVGLYKGMGELKYVTKEGRHIGEQRKGGGERYMKRGRKERQPTAAERAYAARAGSGRAADLPF